jgi:regulatory protein
MGADQDPRARARAVALKYLAAAARSEAQLRSRLERAGLSAEADGVVAWLAGLGYLDDAAWARGRARALLVSGRLGPRAAERKLLQGGIPADRARAAVRAALAEEAPEGELGLCRALAARRTPGVAPDRLDARGRARLARFLLGRGFSGGVVAQVLGGRFDRDADGD